MAREEYNAMMSKANEAFEHEWQAFVENRGTGSKSTLRKFYLNAWKARGEADLATTEAYKDDAGNYSAIREPYFDAGVIETCDGITEAIRANDERNDDAIQD
jgi:hypothetical protein